MRSANKKWMRFCHPFFLPVLYDWSCVVYYTTGKSIGTSMRDLCCRSLGTAYLMNSGNTLLLHHDHHLRNKELRYYAEGHQMAGCQ